MKSLEKSYTDILKQISSCRNRINDALDQLEMKTKYSLDTLMASMRTSIQTDIENCTMSIENMTRLKEHVFGRKDKSEAVRFIKSRKCRDQSLKIEAFLKDMITKNEMALTFNLDTSILEFLSTLSGLGQILSKGKQSQTAEITTLKELAKQEKPTACNTAFSLQRQPSDVNKSSVIYDAKQVISVKSSKTYRVKAKNDNTKCVISGICETVSGELLIADWMNNNVMLLDQTYEVVGHCDLPDGPRSMCSIDSSLVAVTVYSTEVHFIKVTNGLLIKDRILKFTHVCLCIAPHHRNLYITDGRALYRYTVDGRLSSKMYEHTSGGVTTCAVSPNEDRIYVANKATTELVTLSRDGKVLKTLACPRMKWEETLYLPGLHVTDSGQVLVCGMKSNRILQVDKDGRQRLAEVVSDGMIYPTSVYYSKLTDSLIVGMKNNNYIKVFTLQPLSEKNDEVSGRVFLKTI
ncbi:uncharacterized protein LOC127879246 [Dreissena polymorpha]|uniref:uncharacterized protein LOC127879246 n=1 Tax=Dreissena polymorpha TaxID=45954 RepID=UPI0022643E67|nr:uncharacterized protein LOC127879246 [Dreissena polymorpha]